MSTAVPSSPDATPDASDDVRVAVGVHRRRGATLVALSLFQFWLWGTRILNMVRADEDYTTAFIVVHVALYTVAVGAAVVLLVLGARMWREARAPGARP